MMHHKLPTSNAEMASTCRRQYPVNSETHRLFPSSATINNISIQHDTNLGKWEKCSAEKSVDLARTERSGQRNDVPEEVSHGWVIGDHRSAYCLHPVPPSAFMARSGGSQYCSSFGHGCKKQWPQDTRIQWLRGSTNLYPPGSGGSLLDLQLDPVTGGDVS